jgi:hypothetical protein
VVRKFGQTFSQPEWAPVSSAEVRLHRTAPVAEGVLVEDPEDGRRLLVDLTRAGEQTVEKAALNAIEIGRETLAPLTPASATRWSRNKLL